MSGNTNPVTEHHFPEDLNPLSENFMDVPFVELNYEI
jgi:hypothetical protein